MALDLTVMSQAWKDAFITALLSGSDLDTPQMTVGKAALDDSGEASGIANLLRDCARDTRLHPHQPGTTVVARIAERSAKRRPRRRTPMPARAKTISFHPETVERRQDPSTGDEN